MSENKIDRTLSVFYGMLGDELVCADCGLGVGSPRYLTTFYIDDSDTLRCLMCLSRKFDDLGFRLVRTAHVVINSSHVYISEVKADK